MEQQLQQDTVETQDTGIKMNLRKIFFDFLQQISDVEKDIQVLRRQITKAFVNENQQEKDKLVLEKTKKEQEVNKIENELEKYIEEFLSELSESNTKWIIQFYQDRINLFSKQTIIDISTRLGLQIKDDSKILSIARQGKTFEELIKQAIHEEQQRKQNMESNKSNSSTGQQNKKNEAQPTQNGEQKNNQTSNQTTSSSSSQKSSTTPQKKQVAENPETTSTEQGQNKKTPVTNSKKDNQQQDTKKPNTNNNQNNKSKQNSKLENNKKVESNNQEEDAYDIYKKSLQNDEMKKDKKEILKELEEEQKQMNQQEIMESLNLAPDSVSGYEVVSMTNDYILTIKVQVPEQNSFPISGYNVYILRKKEQHVQDLSQDQIKEQVCLDGLTLNFDKELLTTSKSNLINIDLKQIKTGFVQTLNEELSITQISITAFSKTEYESLESQIQYIFRINLPKIITQKTRLMMTGSCALIDKSFFQNEDTFISLYSSQDQAIRQFVTIDSEQFNQFDIQSVNLGNSAMLLLKDGSVVQWGEVVYFLDELTECPLEELEVSAQTVTVYQPFMPAQHPLVFTRIAQGESHYVGVTIDGKVYSWGINSQGQLGHQNQISYPEPKKIDYFFSEKIFIVDVKCAENFTVCQSIDGSLYTFGKHQALTGEPIKDLFNNTINYCNKQVNQLYPRKISNSEKIVQYNCGNDHCIFITEKNNCFIWGNNEFMQVCQNEYYQYVHNFADPIPISVENGADYTFQKVFCSLKTNTAVMQHKKTGDQIYVQWGGTSNKGLDIKRCQININQPAQESEQKLQLRQKPQFINDFSKFYTNTYQNLIVINEGNKSKLYANGMNTFYSLGVSTKNIQNIERVPLMQCEILQASFNDNHTTALLVI